ncbi:MAG: hypothetical protein WA975_15740 [Mesorhizobium sp.]
MSIATASSRPVPRRVVVAIYEHRHGMDIRVFVHERDTLEAIYAYADRHEITLPRRSSGP